MPIPLDALMALKALHIGSAAALSPSRTVALSMLNTAVEHLLPLRGMENRRRLAFYLAVRAELLRKTGDPKPDREALRGLCDEIRSSLYQWYMRLEDSTESRSAIQSQGTASPYSQGGGTNRDPDNQFISPLGRAHRAMDALGLARSELTVSEKRFLEQATLKQLLDKHEIPFAA